MRIPIYSGNRLIGTYAFGPKLSGDPYTQEDRRLLRTFGRNADVALTKADMHQELRAYSERLEERVQERTRHLQEIQSRQREFFDDISHALQTPVTVLKSGMEGLARVAQVPGSRAEASMNASIEDHSRLIASLLKLARLDGDMRASEALVDISAAAGRVAEYVATIADVSGICLVSDIQPDIHVMGDVHQLEEVLTNILSNALKYTASRKIQQVSISAAARDGEAAIEIRDTGIGIPPAQTARIFERFYRTGAKAQGYGLGLAIAKRIVERHRGSIRIESELYVGTSVLITLPPRITRRGSVMNTSFISISASSMNRSSFAWSALYGASGRTKDLSDFSSISAPSRT